MRSVACVGDNVYATWANLENGHWRIYFARSVDGGRSFLPEIPVDEDPGIARHHPAIAARGDMIYIAWQDDLSDGASRGSGVDFDILLVSSSDGGRTFSAPLQVNDNTFRHQKFPSVAVSPVDPRTVYVAWEDERANLPTNDLYFAGSVNGGASFGNAKRVNDDDTALYHYTPAVAADGSGAVYVAWSTEDPGPSGESHIYLDKSTDGGNTFGTDTRVNDAVPNWCYDPSIAVAPSGDVYVAWSDGRSGRFERDIYLAASRTGGASFDNSVKVSRESSLSKQEYPSVGISLGGTVWIAYEDYQRDTGNTGDLRFVDIYVTASQDGGRLFPPPTLINNPGAGGAIAPNLSIRDSDGSPVILWSPVTKTYRDIRLTY
jgi:hypothetical protein